MNRVEDTLRFTEYQPSRTPNRRDSGTVLEDILAHLPPNYGNTYYDGDPITHGHETSHGIHSDLRNNHNPGRTRANGFYVLEDRAVLIQEPNIRKRDANPHVPESLRASRYAVYLEGSASWDDTPLYLWDEWNAYVNGSAVGVDMAVNGLWRRDWRDGVAGTVEFTVYAVAVAMAVEENDPTYFEREPQFLAFLAWNARRGMDIFRKGRQYDFFAWDRQDAYYERFKTDASAEPVRDFCRRHFGEAWVQEVIFGDSVDPNGPPSEPPNDPESMDPPAGVDADGDGVIDEKDLCSNTPEGAAVWEMGEWLGCAAGQFRDPPRTQEPDEDSDGIGDAIDLCSGTRAAATIWYLGPWIGCAEGQFRDRDRP